VVCWGAGALGVKVWTWAGGVDFALGLGLWGVRVVGFEVEFRLRWVGG
jgi:hypothetical protein